MNLTFTVPGPAATKNRRGLQIMQRGEKSFPHSFKTAEVENFEGKIAQFALFARNEAGIHQPIDAPLRIYITVFRKLPKSASNKKREMMIRGELAPTTRPDLDNYEKPIMDALTGVIYNDDSQIVYKASAKYFDDGQGERIVIGIMPHIPGLPPQWSVFQGSG